MKIDWTRKKESEGGYLLECYTTQKFPNKHIDDLFGTVCKVSKPGFISYEYDTYNRTYPGVKSGAEDTLDEAKKRVEEAILFELDSIEKYGKRDWIRIFYIRDESIMPQKFANSVGQHGVKTIPEMEILLRGPEDSQYWDAWKIVLNEFRVVGTNGVTYRLNVQDDELWGVSAENI